MTLTWFIVSYTEYMENPRHSTKEQLASIVSLCKSGQSVNDISEIVGLAERTVQKWVKRFNDGGAVMYRSTDIALGGH